MDDLPYKAEYAKSSRASCQGCKNSINKDELRLAVMVQAPNFDGKMPRWHHFNCFFRVKQLTSVGDIANYQTLRWEDQQRIKNKIVGGNGDASSSTVVSSNSTSEKKPKKSKKSVPPAEPGLQDFSVEYAKSSRSACKSCLEKIMKNDVRISKMIYDSESAHRYGPQPGWHHVDCFVKDRSELGFTEAADQLPGFSSLSNDDKDMLMEKIKRTGQKRKQEQEKPVKKAKVSSKEEQALAAQSKMIYGYRDKLAQLSKKELALLLEHNNQAVPPGESRILDLLADVMTFGALEPCPECKTGQLRFKDGAYHCSGHITEWTKCIYVTDTPIRTKFVVPEELKEDHDFLASYKYIKRDRLRPSNPEAPTVRKTANSTPRPLENFKIALVGDLERPTEEITSIVTDLGGQIVKKIDNSLTCIICTKDEVDKKSKKIKNAEKLGVHVVSEKFLDDVKNGGAALMMSQNLLSTWGGDPAVKVESLNDKLKSSRKREAPSSSTKSSTVKVTVQGPAAVHPESGLQDKARVYEKKGVVYDVVLNRCDITKGYNSYYKMQVLKANNVSRFYVFRMWGRVGTTIGGDKLDSFDSAEEAIAEFELQYGDKTGNEWKNRKNFTKRAGQYFPVDIDYGQDDEVFQAKKLKPGSKSSLEKAVQDLICLLFDVEAMKNAMVEFEIDLKKMPLGKLSKKQVDKAYAVLTELQQIIDGDKSPTKFLDASNRFYTLIPHDFGMKKPPLLDNEEAIKSKIEMLDSLLEIEYAYNLLKGGDKTDEDPIDQHYHQLKTDIETVNKKSDEFERIKTYLSNTHAKTHSNYTLQLEEAFKINRHGEFDRYKKFQSLHNKKLLWHGSRLTNFAGILSQGLRIAPPEAPATGYMFGKGIYFADMVSKSANYCCTSRSNNTGLLLLCEVALGDMYEKTNSEYITKLPDGKHSTKGVGETFPNPEEAVTTSDGVEIPLGKPKQSDDVRSSLLYNEYIVYDVEQVNIKYLLKVNFKYKY